MTLWQLFKTGGPTMYVLLLLSIISIAIILERIIYYYLRSEVKRNVFMLDISQELEKGNIKKALEISKNTDTPFSRVVQSALILHGHNEVVISNTMEREVIIQTTKLEKYTSIVGTIGGTAVYIGLFGTVLGIIRVFHDISKSGSGGITVTIAGISEALVTTAAGLCVAVPAVMAYNYFTQKIDSFISDMELSASEIMDLLNIKK
ncbi:MAG: MotA/TolQ/ExbB proton channel family protein [Candidatus Omnitrophota bacterium]|nr:MotA/TolQ/ExbB proton channel family protein [Candidatus Omnitrophota bacterium]MBU2034673.1 MotA/TolQ/ExbB proton channel family protein [Candidatus Omnitrophota bacterium]MBU2221985.1 MotA/TolQ/ExbB proton channel family protein [Candidatus Omnitrophota bacterium]MBU2257492.1 MotA/TolQ/ExbB proton channel family protein [Candidatus Omnitrophota bacterium]